MDSIDTIFALSSGTLPSGVAVVRISGPHCRAVVLAMVGSLPEPRQARLAPLLHPVSGELLDRGLVLWFPGPASFTGEDCAELQVHGGPAVVGAILAALGCVAGLRLAEPGEFSRRAFLHGKMDLTELEGLADLIASETQVQRRQAVALANGALRQKLDRFRDRIAGLRALVEADFDFSDEADVVDSVAEQVWPECLVLADEINALLADGNRGEIVRSGFQVVLAGRPNSGKSSLLNALAQREVAIVSAEAGTTRDILEVWLDIDGMKVCVADTAGIREAEGLVEREGIRRALDRVGLADLVVWLTEDGVGPGPDVVIACDDLLVLASKDDAGTHGACGVSVVRPNGMENLLGALRERLATFHSVGEVSLVSRQRHRVHLLIARDLLVAAGVSDPVPTEVRAEYLRSAGDEIGKMTGAIGVEELLGRIFAEFCIGK